MFVVSQISAGKFGGRLDKLESAATSALGKTVGGITKQLPISH
jgi:hypothetical protein